MGVSEEEHHHDLDWLALQVLQSNFQWKTNKNFAEISIILNNLSVENDPTERMILLLTERITTVRSEEML